MTPPRRRSLSIEPPADRGPLLSPDQVAAMIGGVSAAWVRRHVPNKIRLGQRTIRFYANDVRAYLESRRSAA